jgi:prevent-host-death family protein
VDTVVSTIANDEGAVQAVGIRELKQQTSEILRRVREEGETIDVTYRGRVVARLVPVDQSGTSDTRDFTAIWADMDRLAAEIGARWPEGLSAADALSEDRREL